MPIWVDADATPRVVKEMLYRAAQRSKVTVTFVANQWLRLPTSPFLVMQVVGKGFDVADEYIAEQAQPGDLVITADVPLAAAVVEKGAYAVDSRGQVIDASNARQRLQMRDFLETVRESGVITGGPKALSERDKRQFAKVLDQWLRTGVVRSN